MMYDFDVSKQNTALFKHLLDKYKLIYTYTYNNTFKHFNTFYIYSKSFKTIINLSIEYGMLI